MRGSFFLVEWVSQPQTLKILNPYNPKTTNKCMTKKYYPFFCVLEKPRCFDVAGETSCCKPGRHRDIEPQGASTLPMHWRHGLCLAGGLAGYGGVRWNFVGEFFKKSVEVIFFHLCKAAISHGKRWREGKQFFQTNLTAKSPIWSSSSPIYCSVAFAVKLQGLLIPSRSSQRVLYRWLKPLCTKAQYFCFTVW